MAIKPYISVILPAYNCERYVSESIESVLSQNYHDFELIIVDDGSTDRTADIIQQFAGIDSRIKVISQRNQGVSAARNAALDVSQGEFVTFIDADDKLADQFLSICVSNRADCDIIAANFTHKIANLDARQINFQEFPPEKYLSEVLYKRLSSPAVWGKLFRRSLFDDIKFWPRRYEDLEIFPRLVLRCSRIAVTDSKLYFYRKNHESFIHSINRNRFDSIKATKSIISLCHAYGNPQLLRAARCRHLSAAFNAFCISADKAEFNAEQMEAREIIKCTRRYVLFDTSAPLKIKSGILASYFGWRMLSTLNRLFKISS